MAGGVAMYSAGLKLGDRGRAYKPIRVAVTTSWDPRSCPWSLAGVKLGGGPAFSPERVSTTAGFVGIC